MRNDPKPPARHILIWRQVTSASEEAVLLNPDGSIGVRFSLSHRPTCYRRGPHRLLIEVLGGPWHYDWGCFDAADQPERNYHVKSNARLEAAEIAKVLVKDFDEVQKNKELQKCKSSLPTSAAGGTVSAASSS